VSDPGADLLHFKGIFGARRVISALSKAGLVGGLMRWTQHLLPAVAPDRVIPHELINSWV
jgi:hypothetical protein